MIIELTDLLIGLILFFGAILYTSVGHAGASVYIAIMSIFGVPVTTIKPTALSPVSYTHLRAHET